MNRLRELTARAIESNGGYSSGYHERYPLEWEVGLYYADLDLDHIYKRAVKDNGPVALPDNFEWDAEQHFSWIQEDMARSLQDGDDCGWKSYDAITAARYGLPFHQFPKVYKRRTNECAFYPTKKDGWILDHPYTAKFFDVTFGLAGRGGKHLVVTEFEGRDMNMRSDDLAEAIRDDEEGNYSNVWCRNLLAMIGEWDETFTSKKASDEMEYLAADALHRELEELAHESGEVQFWAERDVVTA